MKKFIYKGCILLFIFMIMFVQFDLTQVKAADEEVVSYYQGVVGSGTNYNRFTAISQYFYINDAEFGGESSAIHARGIKENVGTAPIHSEDYHYNLQDIEDAGCSYFFPGEYPDDFCNGNQLKGRLFSLTISNFGNVKIFLGNKVALTNLRIYYIIANKSNEAQLYCDDRDICLRARTIIGTDSNWKNMSRTGGGMVFSSSNMVGFTEDNLPGGGKLYTGFNVIDNMNSTYADLAKKYGAYVITSASISYNDKSYDLNGDLSKYTFNGIENGDSDPVKSIINYRLDNVSSIVDVSNAAVLVYHQQEEKGSVGYSRMEGYLDSVIIPALKVIIIVLFLVVGTTTIVTIVKASDEPEVRHSNIKKLISMFVGAVVIYLILVFYKEIIEIVQGWFY